MVRQILSDLYNTYRQIVGNGAVITLFLVCVTVLFLTGAICKKWPVILSPLGTIGYAVSKIIDILISRNGKRYLSAAFAVLIIALAVTSSGSNILASDMNPKAENMMHIPSDIVEAMDAVLADTDEAKVLTMPGWGLYFESYSPAFSLMYDLPAHREAAWMNEYERNAYTELGKVHPDMKKVAEAARGCECGYVVLSNDIWPDVPLTKYGYEIIYETEMCSVYREVETP